MKNILVATDLKANCDRALERLIRLAKAFVATLHILHVARDYQVPGSKKATEILKQDTECLVRSYIAG